MYRRVLNVDGAPVLVAVTQRATVLDVTLTGEYLSPAIQKTIKPVVERLLGTNVDLSEFYAFAAGYPRLGQLATPFRGFKPPRFATVFEGLVNGITCQQLSLAADDVGARNNLERWLRLRNKLDYDRMQQEGLWRSNSLSLAVEEHRPSRMAGRDRCTNGRKST